MTKLDKHFKRVLLIEFNELCPSLLDKWCDEGYLPNFSKFRSESKRFITKSDVTEDVNLEPWIQWYSLHTGMPFDRHRVFHLTEGLKASHSDMFSLCAASGKSVGIFSAMNQKRVATEGGFYFADPWCAGSERAAPESIEPLQSFVSHSVLEHSRLDEVNNGPSKVNFIAAAIKHGLSFSTVWTIVKQLAAEKVNKKQNSWKRVWILDRLSVDVFLHQFKRKRPVLSSFFSNSTAHLQHSHWREMEPEKFGIKPTPENIEYFKDAIRGGYENMDRMLGQLVNAADDDTLLIFCTALSQEPYLAKESIGGQNFYRLRDPDAFLKELGIDNCAINPIMNPRYKLVFESADGLKKTREILKSLSANGKPLLGILDSENLLELTIGCTVNSTVSDKPKSFDLEGRNIEFSNHFYLLDGVKSGSHNHSGVCWIKTGNGSQTVSDCSVLDIFPTVMNTIGLSGKIPGDRRKQSLLA
jgi:hypothetical protein